MKPILKALTSPFRSSKTKKSKKQSSPNNEDDHMDTNNTDNFQSNIDMQKGVNKENLKLSDIYGQVQKMVDQLGNMFNFKQKMTQSQKRQLIYQLSSMALKEKKLGNNLFDEDVLESQQQQDGHEHQQHSPNQQHHHQQSSQNTKPKQLQSSTKKSLSDALTSSNSIEKSQQSPSNSSPQKQLKDLFQYFQTQQNTVSQKNSGVNEVNMANQKKIPKQEQFMDIKSQISKFWEKNSSKVLRLMKGKKHQKHSMKTLKKTSQFNNTKQHQEIQQHQIQEQHQIQQSISHSQSYQQSPSPSHTHTQSLSQSQSHQQQPRLKKKKSSFVNSLFSSWNNSKKEQKTLSSTAANSMMMNDNNNINNVLSDVIDDDFIIKKQRQQFQESNRAYEQNVTQQTRLGFGINDRKK